MNTNIILSVVSFLSMCVALVAAGRADTHRILARDARHAADFAVETARLQAARAEAAGHAADSAVETAGCRPPRAGPAGGPLGQVIDQALARANARAPLGRDKGAARPAGPLQPPPGTAGPRGCVP